MSSTDPIPPAALSLLIPSSVDVASSPQACISPSPVVTFSTPVDEPVPIESGDVDVISPNETQTQAKRTSGRKRSRGSRGRKTSKREEKNAAAAAAAVAAASAATGSPVTPGTPDTNGVTSPVPTSSTSTPNAAAMRAFGGYKPPGARARQADGETTPRGSVSLVNDATPASSYSPAATNTNTNTNTVTTDGKPTPAGIYVPRSQRVRGGRSKSIRPSEDTPTTTTRATYTPITIPSANTSTTMKHMYGQPQLGRAATNVDEDVDEDVPPVSVEKSRVSARSQSWREQRERERERAAEEEEEDEDSTRTRGRSSSNATSSAINIRSGPHRHRHRHSSKESPPTPSSPLISSSSPPLSSSPVITGKWRPKQSTGSGSTPSTSAPNSPGQRVASMRKRSGGTNTSSRAAIEKAPTPTPSSTDVEAKLNQASMMFSLLSQFQQQREPTTTSTPITTTTTPTTRSNKRDLGLDVDFHKLVQGAKNEHEEKKEKNKRTAPSAVVSPHTESSPLLAHLRNRNRASSTSTATATATATSASTSASTSTSEASPATKATSTTTSTLAEHDQLYRHAKQAEAKLAALLANSSKTSAPAPASAPTPATSQTIADLRKSLRDAYVQLMFLHPIFASRHQVAHKLWMLFYKEIESHLNTVRMIRSQQSSMIMMVSSEEEARHQLQQILDRIFMFIERLVEKMTSHFQSEMEEKEKENQENSTVSSQSQSPSSASNNRSPTPPSTSTSTSTTAPSTSSSTSTSTSTSSPSLSTSLRSLICMLYTCLGDLERYRQLHSQPTNGPDWGRTVYYYNRALDTHPGNGKAHNQLAVVAQYTSDEFESVYQYIRSIHALQPFPARENLLSLYERNRQSVWNLQHVKSQNLSPLNLCLLRLIRVVAILDTRISVETFPDLFSSMMSLFHLLIDKDSLHDHMILKILVLIITSVETSFERDIQRYQQEYTSENHSIIHLMSTESPVTLSSLTRHACALMYEVFGSLLRCTAINLTTLRYLAPISVFTLWLCTHPILITSAASDRVDFFKTGLAQLINGLNSPSYQPQQQTSRVPSLLPQLRGFKPLESVPAFASAPTDLDRSWQVTSILSCAHLLHHDPTTGRYSAYETSHVSVARDEIDALVASITQTTITPTTTITSAKKKRPSKQSATRREKRNVHVNEYEMIDENGEEEEEEEEQGEEEEEDSITYTPTTSSTTATSTPSTLSEQEQQLRRLIAAAEQDPKLVGDKALRVQAPILSTPSSTIAIPTSATSTSTPHKRLIIIDVANVAMRHGHQKLFSTMGIHLVIEYYQKQGHRVLGFMPDYYLDYEYVGNKRRQNAAGLSVHAAKIPDNVSLLLSWRDEGLIVSTPAQDYDDSYCLQYAIKHDAIIISNDRYRDYVQKQPTYRQAEIKLWLRQHVISYTFIGNEFLPNPDFKIT